MTIRKNVSDIIALRIETEIVEKVLSTHVSLLLDN